MPLRTAPMRRSSCRRRAAEDARARHLGESGGLGGEHVAGSWMRFLPGFTHEGSPRNACGGGWASPPPATRFNRGHRRRRHPSGGGGKATATCEARALGASAPAAGRHATGVSSDPLTLRLSAPGGRPAKIDAGHHACLGLTIHCRGSRRRSGGVRNRAYGEDVARDPGGVPSSRYVGGAHVALRSGPSAALIHPVGIGVHTHQHTGTGVASRGSQARRRSHTVALNATVDRPARPVRQ